jgi:hypothetical protein
MASSTATVTERPAVPTVQGTMAWANELLAAAVDVLGVDYVHVRVGAMREQAASAAAAAAAAAAAPPPAAAAKKPKRKRTPPADEKRCVRITNAQGRCAMARLDGGDVCHFHSRKAGGDAAAAAAAAPAAPADE